jgi:hypothetical protein
MRNGLTTGYSALGWLVSALVWVQVFLAGLGIFGASSFSAHELVGGILHLCTLLVFLFAVAGPRTGRDIGMGLLLFLITTGMTFLPGTRDDAPELAAFHPVFALVILGLAAHIGTRYLGRGRGGGSTAAA